MHADLAAWVEAHTPIDLTAKWKHGWIPLNAEAEAILAAKAKHGEDHIPHGAMLAMPLADLKQHYSKTIKTHGFQHPYTKQVGKAVGSHPESLAKTKATNEAKKAEAGGVKLAPDSAVKPQLQATLVNGKLQSIQPKAAPTVADVAKPITGAEKVKAAAGGKKVEQVLSYDGTHIGYAIHTGHTPKYQVHNLDGTELGSVNSFTGAQHVLGETKLGKAPAPPAPHTQTGTKVVSAAHMAAAPDGTTVTWTSPNDPSAKHTFVKQGGKWVGENPADQSAGLIEYKPTHFATSLEKQALTWGGPAPKPKPLPKPASDTPIPGTNHYVDKFGAVVSGTSGDSVGSVAKGGQGWESYDAGGDPIALNHATEVEAAKAVLADAGEMDEPPAEDKSTPKYELAPAASGSGWAVKNTHTGQFVPGTWVKGKPNASKKANDLNKAEGYAHNGKTGGGAAKSAAVATVEPHELNHPAVPVGASREEQIKHTFDGSKAGALKAEAAAGAPTPNEHLKFHEQNNADNKRQTARQIGDWMAAHQGYHDQARLDTAWVTYGKISGGGVFWGDKPPQGFLGTPDDPYNAQVINYDRASLTVQKNGAGDYYQLLDKNGNQAGGAIYGQEQADKRLKAIQTDPVIERGTPEYQSMMREKIVGNMVQLWAASSNDDHAVTLSLQDKAASMFGITDYHKWTKHSASTKQAMEKYQSDPDWDHLAEAFLQSQYDATQARLQAEGITHLVLRRGTKAGVPTSVDVGGTANLKMRPMSSWSTDSGVATNFAGGKSVLQVKVPIQKVIGFAGNGFGCTGEREVVVLGGNTEARLIKRGAHYTSDYYANP